MPSKKCRECGRFISADEIVCNDCADKGGQISKAFVTRANTRPRDIYAPEYDDGIIDIYAVQLKKDIDYLMSLGIKLEKGKLATHTGGAVWAGYEAFTGDWLSALVVGGISLLAGPLTNSYKRIKLMEMKQKWMNVLSTLSHEELDYLAAGLAHKYPLLLSGFQNLLQAGQQQ